LDPEQDIKMADFKPPEVKLGDSVYWYHDATNPADPALGWVCRRPGINTVSVLVFAPEVGFVEKPSVRHRGDPGLQENAAWRQWGCWDFSAQSAQLRRLDTVATSLITNSERQAKKTNGK
jgi:hypothetical protein